MEQVRGTALSLFRIVVGLLFACHGAATLFNVLGGPHGGPVPHFAAWPGWWAAMIELCAGTLVMLGLGTRVAAFLCSGSMAYAYFTVHQPKALFPIVNGGEPAAMFCWSFLLIAVLGGGPLALEALIGDRARPVVARKPVVAESKV
ncbi:MAG TPA: DoxX family protein [Streptosporangiaceae bacterium]